jgi:hypothetical protein
VQREECRECKPKPELPKIILVLSENEPQQKTSPESQSNPSFRNSYTCLRRNNNDRCNSQQANNRNSNELGSLQGQADEPPMLPTVSSCSNHLALAQDDSETDCLRNQAITLKFPPGEGGPHKARAVRGYRSQLFMKYFSNKNPNVFTLYNNWDHLSGQPKRQSVARGQALFNTFPIAIRGVGGLNDVLNQPVIYGTCTTCHDGPNVGNHSVSVPLAVGTTSYPVLSALDVSGLPVYTVRCSDGSVVDVTDIGRAMKSGKCADVGKLKGPILRGLAGRAPYFHNGAATTLDDGVDFYNQHFGLSLTAQQHQDLVAFLQTL